MKVNDIEMYYEVSGKGVPVILIHGVTISHILWKLQVPEFSQHFKVVNLDLRNHGDSTKVDSEITMELLADDVKELLDGLKIENAYIVGESMGCFVSLEFALKYPECTRALILTCGAWADNTLLPAKMLMDSWIEHFREGGDVFFRKDVPSIACRKCRQLKEAHDLFDEYEKLLRNYPKETMIWVFKGIKKFNVKNRLSQIECPTLIIHGKRDRLIPLPFVREMHTLIKNAQLEILDGCHFALVHNHEKFNEIIIEFLKELEF
jgi:3-oxoadipate enol-lactonase